MRLHSLQQECTGRWLWNSSGSSDSIEKQWLFERKASKQHLARGQRHYSFIACILRWIKIHTSVSDSKMGIGWSCVGSWWDVGSIHGHVTDELVWNIHIFIRNNIPLSFISYLKLMFYKQKHLDFIMIQHFWISFRYLNVLDVIKIKLKIQ